MQKHEGVADVLVLKEMVSDLERRFENLCLEHVFPESTHRFLYLTGPRLIRDLEHHPLGDKRPYITRFLKEAAACENAIIESENYVRN